MNKEYIIKQIIRVENIIKEQDEKITISKYCTREERKKENRKNLKNTLNYKIYKEDKMKYDLSEIQYKYFGNSYVYKKFSKDVLLEYLDELIKKAYELELLDMNFSY